MAKKQDPALTSWTELNDALMGGDEALAKRLLKEESSGRRRSQFLKRIHSRLNKLRADRERAELEKFQ